MFCSQKKNGIITLQPHITGLRQKYFNPFMSVLQLEYLVSLDLTVWSGDVTENMDLCSPTWKKRRKLFIFAG